MAGFKRKRREGFSQRNANEIIFFAAFARTFASFALKFFLGPLVFLFLTQPCFSKNPQVLKVEPPSWWTGHTINPVRLLIRGTNLRGARVSAPTGLRIDATKINDAG